jgi:hypothetical protein
VGDAGALAAPESAGDGTGASWVTDDGAVLVPSLATEVCGDELHPASSAAVRTTISGTAVREEATRPLLTLDGRTWPSY